MNIYVTGIKKDLVPKILVNGQSLYLVFVHEASKRPLRYFDLINEAGRLEEYDKYQEGDSIYPIGVASYFHINDAIMHCRRRKYNLMKKKHEYNRRKYGKIRSNNNTV